MKTIIVKSENASYEEQVMPSPEEAEKERALFLKRMEELKKEIEPVLKEKINKFVADKYTSLLNEAIKLELKQAEDEETGFKP